MRLGYQNHYRKNSENSSNINQNSNENNSDNEEYSSQQEKDPNNNLNINQNNNNNNKLNKSFTEDDSSSKPKKSQNQIKEKTYYQFIAALLSDKKKDVKKILDSYPNQGIADHPSIEGLSPIQYSALYGCLDCFEYLLNLKVDTDRKVEGLNLIHLSLSKSIFKNEKENCVKMFNYIYDKLPEQREYKDRLGRTFLHIIFEYDFEPALKNVKINLNDLFIQDNDNNFVIDYVFIYNSNQCFWKVAKDPEFLAKLYKEIRIRYESNKKRKEDFLGNLFIHQNDYSIAILTINCKMFINELLEDLNNLNNFYTNQKNINNNINNNYNNENKNIYNLLDNIKYALNIVSQMKKGNEFKGTFNFPQKLRYFTAVIYNYNCIQHIKLPEEPLKHLMARISLFENSDRLACLIDTEKNGIILNDQVLHYEKGITYEEKINKNLEHTACESIFFYESNRKSCLNDILKCHDLTYINKLKELCQFKSNNNSSFKKNENFNNKISKISKGLNIPKLINKMDTTNPLYKNFFNTNYQSHLKKLDIDTYINDYSFENIFNTSGCVLDAVDMVLQDKVKNAFVLTRPPGHNAGYFGNVENISSGFCLVNNICIGAAYAKNKYRNEIIKVAIFDFDAHHGNGTEEIVQMLDSKIFEKKFMYDKLLTELRTRNIKQINWTDGDDAKNVLYISTHIFNNENKNNKNNFYPFTGSTETNTKKNSPIYPGGIFNIPLNPNNYNNKIIKGEEYRNIIRTKVIPRLYEFKPDIIFLSAGFDSHENEMINEKYISLNEFDYAFITQQIQFVANKFCKGRVISVLEGGYNISAIIISSFGQSVFTHTRFLNQSLNMFQVKDIKLTGFKREPNYNEEEDNINNNDINNNIDLNNGMEIRDNRGNDNNNINNINNNREE